MKGAVSNLKVPEQPAELPTFILSGAVEGAGQSCTLKLPLRATGVCCFWEGKIQILKISLLGGVFCRAEGALHPPAVLLQLQGAGKCWGGIMAALSRQCGYIEVWCDK